MTTLSVMTFNLRGARAPDGQNAWPNRRDLMARVIQAQAPDLIGVQEVHAENFDWFAAALPGYERRLGPPYNNHEPFQYPSILWRPTALELIDAGEFWLSETPDRHSASWGTDCIRSAQWIRFRVRAGGREFVHLNTHLDHVSAEARLNGARLIVDQLCRLGDTPVVVTGDFNCEPGAPPYDAFIEAGFTDAHRTAGGADGPDVFTFHAFTGRRKLGRIDWILASPAWTVRACRIVTDAAAPLYPSDHFPVVADLALC